MAEDGPGGGDAAAARDVGGFDSIVFQQELNEVYLLLDFISGHPDKNLCGVDGVIDNPYFIDEHPAQDLLDKARQDGLDITSKKLSLNDVVKRVSFLRFPPAGSKDRRGEDAAFLLALKDKLNGIAYPARGTSIAYTTIFSGTDPKPDATGRVEIANKAFPTFAASARLFRHVNNMLSWGTILLIVIAALSLWQVTYGVQLAARFDEARKNDSDSAEKIFFALEKGKKSDGEVSTDLRSLCAIGKANNATGTTPVNPTSPDGGKDGAGNPIPKRLSETDTGIRMLCNEYAYRHAIYCVSIVDVGEYSKSFLFKVAEWFLPMHSVARAACDESEDNKRPGKQEDAPSVAGVLAMMANYLLPILFGFAGAMTSLVRSIQEKVNDSVLLPRDLTVSLIRLPLGMVAGVSVGLFFDPMTISSTMSGSVGAFTITASGVAFLAGYGADAFFRVLDALIARIFTLGDKEPRGAT